MHPTLLKPGRHRQSEVGAAVPWGAVSPFLYQGDLSSVNQVHTSQRNLLGRSLFVTHNFNSRTILTLGAITRVANMSVLPRRRLLSFGAAALAVTAVAVPARTVTERATVQWNSRTKSWPTRPSSADFGLVFLSTNDPSATPPCDPNTLVGDIWTCHPDAVAA